MPLRSGASQFTQTHGFVTGMILVTIGVVGVYGSITGNLSGMLAALFDPTDLVDVKTGQPAGIISSNGLFGSSINLPGGIKIPVPGLSIPGIPVPIPGLPGL